MDKMETVLALGFFDGIHVGHAALLRRAKERAAQLGARPAVLTFDRHPDTFVKKEEVPLISSAADRIYIAKKFFGIDDVFFIHFNEHTMKMEWQSFIDGIIEKYNAVHFVVGHDFCFGYRGLGKALMLKDYCEARGLGCDIIPAVMRDGEAVSSTRIRRLLLDGEIEKANELLGHPYLMSDSVRTGFRLGRTMEAPTINMVFQENVLIPRHGVYAARVLVDGGCYHAVTNVGVRPTFDGDNVTVETNILGFDGDLYGHRAVVEFFSFLRPEKKFESPELLMEQIKSDGRRAEEILEKYD